jgi:hypothetical protein
VVLDHRFGLSDLTRLLLSEVGREVERNNAVAFSPEAYSETCSASAAGESLVDGRDATAHILCVTCVEVGF